jgi:hypothetical protein
MIVAKGCKRLWSWFGGLGLLRLLDRHLELPGSRWRDDLASLKVAESL